MCSQCEEDVKRPVHRSDILVLFAELIHNIFQAFSVLAESFYELSIYNARRNVSVHRVWEDFATDLETIQEDTDGA